MFPTSDTPRTTHHTEQGKSSFEIEIPSWITETGRTNNRRAFLDAVNLDTLIKIPLGEIRPADAVRRMFGGNGPVDRQPPYGRPTGGKIDTPAAGL
ncbi:MAG: hypothetical protein A3G34_04185 [Candidatus Lindowbacteria bacterium RIFCSPLOWO2_12_FULL_62_27]|nr:MAG: hypothetical protein A3G34_04185 [Candidatus Lindowbacteria bacterium RIFCSPLOWO2_12_FULL_62_27]OGH63504.1 MAG: hypothetical protein A3I06_13540 [Candidatus Lindowbacteria bacterium RIFCSPLOWO2_02_FULL_62_12]